MADVAPASRTAAGLTDALESDRIYLASQWQLMWWRLKKHHLALAAAVVLSLFYVVALGAEFLAVSDPRTSDANRSFMPPQRVHLFDGWKPSPHVFPISSRRDPVSFLRIYVPDTENKIPIRLFARGYEYKFLGIIPTDRHLIGIGGGSDAKSEDTIFFLGTDQLGRDQWSRLMLATRISMSIGLVAVAISILLGVTLGGLSGYYGGWTDNIIQRVIEVLRSIPPIPLWMGLAASVPRDWSVIKMYFAITIIISLIGWTTLAREVRGRFLSLREEDFVMAAELAGAGRMRIIFRHMMPSFMSHIIASVTLALPAIIISETSLSFLGLGLRPPAISWGVMLQAAQNVQSVALYPWMLLTAVPVIVAVLAFNFLGDGLRDAADPYGQ